LEILTLLEQFEHDPIVAGMEGFQLMARLISEQCELIPIEKQIEDILPLKLKDPK
jgi:hypothetical protein